MSFSCVCPQYCRVDHCTGAEDRESENGVAFIVNVVLEDIGHATPERRYCFTMDNLAAHKNAAVAALIHGHGHRLVFRAPYYPMDGPIEYVFNTLQGLLRSNMHNIHDAPTLLNEIGNAIGAMDDFEPYFLNCRFWRN